VKKNPQSRPAALANALLELLGLTAACIILLAAAFTACASLTGCAGSLEESRTAGMNARRAGAADAKASSPERCQALDNRHQLAGMVGKGAAVLAGASGLAAIPVDDPDQRGLRAGLAIGSVTAAAVAAGALFVSEAAADSWARECASQ
jgi:hypothetical protein